MSVTFADDVLSEDWIKTMAWDVTNPDGTKVKTLPQLMEAIAPRTLERFLQMPASLAMPPVLKAQVLQATTGAKFAHLTTKAAATGKPAAHTGVMLAWMCDPETARKLALPGGEPVGDLHLTLIFLGDTEAVTPEDAAALIQSLKTALSDFPPLSGAVSGFGRFSGEGESDPYYASVDVPGLNALHELLRETAQTAGLEPASDHGFTPHITLAYMPKGAPLPDEPPPKLPLRVGAVTLAYGDERTEIPLRGSGTAAVRKMLEWARGRKYNTVHGEHGHFASHGGGIASHLQVDPKTAPAVRASTKEATEAIGEVLPGMDLTGKRELHHRSQKMPDGVAAVYNDGEFFENGHDEIRVNSAKSFSKEEKTGHFIHEFGHYLDKRVLGEKDGTFETSIDGSPIKKVLKAAAQTPTIRGLVRKQVHGRVTGMGDVAADYALRPHEIFARAFHQYVTERTTNPSVKASIGDSQIHAWGQWEKEEFKPVAAALDEYFTGLGWRGKP